MGFVVMGEEKMSRLIDAEKLEQIKFHPLPYTHITPSDADAESYKRGWNDAIDAIIEQEPTIEPERKKGKWIPVDSYSAFGGDETSWMAHGNPIAFYYCSECKRQAYAGEDGDSLITDFCPNCGADMRGE